MGHMWYRRFHIKQKAKTTDTSNHVFQSRTSQDSQNGFMYHVSAVHSKLSALKNALVNCDGSVALARSIFMHLALPFLQS